MTRSVLSMLTAGLLALSAFHAQAQECGNGVVESGEACDDQNTAGGDGCDAGCQVETGWACRAGTAPSLCGSAAVAGDVTVTEIMNNPACVGDTDGEWLEIHNTSGGTLELRGWLLADAGTDAFVVPELALADGAHAVLCRNGDVATNGNVTCNLVFTGTSLGNGADEIVLSDPADTLVDQVVYDDGATFPDPSGASMSLEPGTDAGGNDDGANWCEAPEAIPSGCGDLGSPGAANPACGGCADADGDGYEDEACGGDDCDDTNDQVHPGAAEDCGDGVDNDCDGQTDADDTDCGIPENCGDGVVDTGEGCDDGNNQDGDGCSAVCQVESGWACRAGTTPSLCGSAAAAGDVTVTEIMNNPGCVGDTDGEWLEIHNTSGGTLELRGWLLADAGTDAFVVPELALADGAHAVLCRNGDVATNGNVTCNLVFTGTSLGNGADEVVLSDPADTLVDQVVYDDGATFPDPSGASMSLAPGTDAGGNDDGANWCEAPEAIPSGCGDLGSPGAANPACGGCADADGDGYEDEACGGDDCDDTNDQVHPGAAEDCGDGVDNDCDGQTDADDTDCGIPENCGDGVVDTGEGCDDGNNQDGDGCSAVCQVESGWACRAGTTPSLCGSAAAAGDVTVTEIMNNPGCVGDTDGEWLEIHNTSGGTLELRGWLLADAGTDAWVVDADLAVAAGARAVLCRNGDGATNGNVGCDAVYSGFTLGNGADEVVLSDPADTLVDQVVYDDGATFPDPSGASMSLAPGTDAGGNDDGANWCEAPEAIPSGCGDLGSPGAANPACGGGCADADGDGYEDEACGGDDCDDTSDQVHPGATEDCGDGVDNDCDGQTDADDPDCGAVEYCGDGVVDAGEACDDGDTESGDGCSDVCQVESGWACRAGTAPSLCGSAAAAGDVTVTEIMNNPGCVGDSDGEWLEIRNDTSGTLHLRGWLLADGGSDAWVVDADLAVAAGARAVLCRNGDSATNGNVGCNAVYSGVTLGNGADGVILSDPADVLVDQVVYDDGATFPDPSGASMSLAPGTDAGGNDDGANWCEGSDAIPGGCGDLATPGAENPACASPCWDNDGDGYEDQACGGNDCDDGNADVYPGNQETLCDGLNNDCNMATPDDPNPTDADGDGHTVGCGDCDDANDQVNPEASEDCVDGIDNDCDGLTDTDDPDCDGVEICGDGVVEGSESCDDGNDTAGDGCSGTCQVEAGWACRAGIEPSLCGSQAAAGAVTVTEIMSDPACVADTDGEWLEIHNTGGQALELRGWLVADAGSDAYVVPGLLLADDGRAVLCRNGDSATNGNVPCDLVFSGFTLANGFDEVILSDPSDTLVDQVAYDDGATFPDPSGASMALEPGTDAAGNDDGLNWCQASEAIPGGCGDLGTPGAANSACGGGCADVDGDGFEDAACGGDDCDDANDQIHPGADEVCDDGTDNDCDGLTDGEDPDCGALEYCGNGIIESGEDCDDGNDLAGDGCSAACQVEAGWACRAGTEPSLCGSLAVAGEVVITEIMNNPGCVGDTDGEWIEVHNTSTATIELRGWSLADTGADLFILGDLALAAGGYAVLCRNGDTATNGNVACDAVYSGVTLGNGDDEVLLADPADTLIDGVVYDDGVTFPDPDGASMSLGPGVDASGNDDGANWCQASGAIPGGCGDLGSPGQTNPECGPVCDDADGDGYEDAACGGDDCDDTNDQVHPGASEVCNDTVDNDCDGLTDADDPDCGAVEYCGNGVVDAGETCDDGNLAGGDGCDPDCQTEAGWTCRPGEEPSVCGSTGLAGEVVITEIMNNPGCVGDTEGEWFEIRNAAGRALELRGWSLGDDGSDHAVLSSLALPAGGRAVLCRNQDVVTNGGVTCDGSYAGVTLGNGTDEISLADPADTLVDRVAWDDGATFPDPSGASMSLQPGLDADGNDTGTNWCQASDPVPGGCGDLGSPGAINPVCSPVCQDADGDGYEDEACGGDDCNDADDQVHPGAIEVCDDGVDNDCDAATDADDPDCATTELCGNGTIDEGEACDDGNPEGGDGCSADCQVEAGWACRAGTVPSLCGSQAEAGGVTVTEIMNNPYCASDTEGEWIEIRNDAGRALELRGWMLGDDDQDTFVLEGFSLEADAYAVLCRNADSMVNGGVACDLEYSGMTLGNGSDAVIFYDPADALVDAVAWDDGTTFPDPSGASMSLSPGSDAAGNDEGAAWCEAPSAIEGGCGDSGSPGTANPACGGECADADGDGYEDEACGGDDCDDGDAGIHPGAEEICDDGIDQDCNGSDLACGCPDADSDGYEDAACGGTDCDDTDAAIHPGADEDCADGVDNDCDGDTDAEDDDCGADCDADGDGYEAESCGGDDCDDTDAAINPEAEEDCDDGVDNDCNGDIDGDDAWCAGCPDADGDGYRNDACGGDDCDDSNAGVFPGAIENCSDDVDNDCDGLTDGDDPDCPSTGGGGCGCGGGRGPAGPPGGAAVILALLLGLGLLRRRTATP